MKIRNMISLAVLFALIAVAAFFRLAPTDPARWHIDPGTVAVTDCTQIATENGATRVSCLRPEDPATLLAKLDGIALATPRTVRLAGSAETGRITWTTRSLIWGFPDFTTVAATAVPEGTRLDILARQRWGRDDMGVNAKRLTAWMQNL